MDINVLTHYGKGIERAIKTPVRITNLTTAQEYMTEGVWDTGATCSCITKAAAQQLGLIPIAMMTVGGVHGSRTVPVYYVQLTLNNENISMRVRVSEGDTASFSREGDAAILIGMDIISQGDFCISNFAGRTVMTFRRPSLETIDYCKEVADLKRYIKMHELNVKFNRPDKCGCGSGRLFSNCHGKNKYNQ